MQAVGKLRSLEEELVDARSVLVQLEGPPIVYPTGPRPSSLGFAGEVDDAKEACRIEREAKLEAQQGRYPQSNWG